VNVASAVSVFSLLSNLPVRFRVYDQAKPYRRVGADTPTATALRVHNNA
jgi:hypothetical protein